MTTMVDSKEGIEPYPDGMGALGRDIASRCDQLWSVIHIFFL